MQRLLNLLRNSQNYCSDNQCVQDMPGPQGDPAGDGMSMTMMMMMGWVVIATALFLLRPPSLRRVGDQKPRPAEGDDQPPPPPPPVV